MNGDPIGEFLQAVQGAAIHEADVYAEDAVLDATVPNWRLKAVGPQAIKAEYAKWFSDPATFVALERIPVQDGELVIYEHEWMQDGVRHRGHHAHHLVVRDGRIAERGSHEELLGLGGTYAELFSLQASAYR
jgi:ketosteroid isomerase-like protein